MSVWDGAAPQVSSGSQPATDWYDLKVLVHRSALRMSPQRYHALAKAKRLKDNGQNDICKRVSVLESVMGYKATTLSLLLTPDNGYADRRKGFDADKREPVLSDYLRLRTTYEDATNADEGLLVDEVQAHVWHSTNDDEPRWKIDVTPIQFKVETDKDGKPRKVLASPANAFLTVPYHWMYQHPDEHDGNTWVEKRYTAMVKDKKTGLLVKRDVTARAIRGASTVQACATHDFKRGQRYGIAGLATVAGVSQSTMAEDLGYAEDAGLIGVGKRSGRNTALRWVRLHPSDPISTEPRIKRSYGPTPEHNAEVMEERRLAREAQAALDAQREVEADEMDAAAEAWLRSLPGDPAVPAMGYAAGDEAAAA